MSFQHAKAADAGALGTGLLALVGYLPEISALLTILWMAIRIYETDTVQRLLGRRRRRASDAAEQGS
jgi:hypothetical protein